MNDLVHQCLFFDIGPQKGLVCLSTNFFVSCCDLLRVFNDVECFRHPKDAKFEIRCSMFDLITFRSDIFILLLESINYILVLKG